MRSSSAEKKTSVIVEFIHEPADVARVKYLLSRTLDINDSGFDYAEATRLALSDQSRFMQELDKIFGGNGQTSGAYLITNTYNVSMNGVAITLPQSKVSVLTSLDFIAAVHPDLPHEAH